jgi:hypothetical protein
MKQQTRGRAILGGVQRAYLDIKLEQKGMVHGAIC